jgi:hypothetical protein
VTEVSYVGQENPATWLITIAKRRVKLGLLFAIICGINKYSRIETASYGVTAVNYHTVHVCLDEFIIKDDIPLSIIHFARTMRHESTVGSLSTNSLRCKGFEGIWKLWT